MKQNKMEIDPFDNLTEEEEVAIYESGLSADGCLDKLDTFTREAIVRYGRMLRKDLEKIISDTLRELPVGNIYTHTPESIPERVRYWVKEAVEECRLKEEWKKYVKELVSKDMKTCELPCKPDHNGECLVCDCWLSDCPFVKKD